MKYGLISHATRNRKTYSKQGRYVHIYISGHQPRSHNPAHLSARVKRKASYHETRHRHTYMRHNKVDNPKFVPQLNKNSQNLNSFEIHSSEPHPLPVHYVLANR